MGSPDPTVSAYAKSSLMQIGDEYDQKIIQMVTQDPTVNLFPSEGHGRRATHTPMVLMGYIRGHEASEVAAAWRQGRLS